MTEAQTIGMFLWLIIIVFSLILYMVLDGFDLGIGMLLPTERDETRRYGMIEIVATVWDGNESWLLLIPIGLFGGFPLAYGTLFPALYIPVIVMLFALIFRGISFEFQAQYHTYSRVWGFAFTVGSVVAAFCQGVILGTFLSGIPVSNGQFSGGPFNFLSPFSILVGLLVMAVYGMLGAGWLIHKSEGELRSSSRRRGHVLVVVVAVLLLIALAATPFATPIVGNLLDSTGRLVLVVAMLVVAAVGLVGAYVAFNRRDDTLPFLCAALAVTALIVGGVGAVYPYAVPPTITFQQATSPSNSINFLLVVTVLAVPVTMVYNAYTYYVFRGKFELPRPRGTDNR